MAEMEKAMKRKKAIVVSALCILVFIGAAIGHVYFRQIRWPARHMEAASKAIPRPAVIAHRGASWYAPEETEPAYLLARDLGADYLELDVQRTKDRILVAFHDDRVERTTNAAQIFPGREKDGIADFTLAELKQLDAGSWFNKAYPDRARPKFAGVKILTVEEVIAIAESGTNKPALYMETKSPARHAGYEAELVDLLKRRNWLGTFDNGMAKSVFQSFSIASLRRIKELAPDSPRVYLIGMGMPKEIGWDKLIADAKEVGCGIGPVGLIAWPWNNAKAHNAALHIHAYTANHPWQFRVFSWFGVDGFFTDRCDLLMQYYGKKPGGAPETLLGKQGY